MKQEKKSYPAVAIVAVKMTMGNNLQCTVFFIMEKQVRCSNWQRVNEKAERKRQTEGKNAD